MSFPHYLVNGTLFEKKVTDHKTRVFSLQLSYDTFLIIKRTGRDRSTIYLGLNVHYRYSCQISMKLEFSGRILEKSSNTKYH